MPIYEFYCADCHALLNFLARAVDTTSRPACPRCGRPQLERRPARFAALTRSRGGSGEEADAEETTAGLGDERLEGALAAALADAGGTPDTADPRSLARVFRRLGEIAGLDPGPRLEQMLGRLEAGEDPEALEDDMAALEGAMEGEEGGIESLFRPRAGGARRRERPRVDPALYFL